MMIRNMNESKELSLKAATGKNDNPATAPAPTYRVTSTVGLLLLSVNYQA